MITKINSLIFSSTLILATTYLSSIARAGTIRDDRTDWQYTSLANSFPSVGYLGTKFSSGANGCSATLIDPSYILTAAHCIDANNQAPSNATFWAGDIPYPVTTATAHQGWFSSNRDFGSGYDLAVLRLATPVLHIPSAPLFTGFSEHELVGTYVGFGATGKGLTGYYPQTVGTKRAGQNIIESGSSFGLSDLLLLSDFDSPFTANSSNISSVPLHLEYLIAPGDSGGGLFINGHVAGVHSFGWGLYDGWNNSSYYDISASTRVSAHINWIHGAMSAMEMMESKLDFNLTNDQVNVSHYLTTIAPQYNYFDESYQVAFMADWGFENYQSQKIPQPSTNKADDDSQSQPIPEPSTSYGILVLGILSILSILTRWHY